jgi:hypothetical protein
MGYPIILKQLDYFMCNSWRENCCKKFKKIKVLAIRSQFIFYTSQTTKSRRLRFYQSTKQKKFARKNIYFLIFRTHSDDFLEIKKNQNGLFVWRSKTLVKKMKISTIRLICHSQFVLLLIYRNFKEKDGEEIKLEKKINRFLTENVFVTFEIAFL